LLSYVVGVQFKSYTPLPLFRFGKRKTISLCGVTPLDEQQRTVPMIGKWPHIIFFSSFSSRVTGGFTLIYRANPNNMVKTTSRWFPDEESFSL
jgi:hypothetical protein